MLCAGTGQLLSPSFSNFYVGTLRVSEFLDRQGRKKKRVRIEISRAMIEELMKHFDHGEKVAVYLAPLNKEKKTADELGEMLE